VRLILILGDQLSEDLSALEQADKQTDIVVMAEVMAEATYVPHHPKKIAFIFAAMRKFAAKLIADGWQVAYTKLDDADNTNSIQGELLRRAEEFDGSEVIATEPGEWRLIEALNDGPLKITQLQDTRFIASHAEFEAWAEGRKELRMEWFYRDMRRKTGLLMEGDKPVEGKWNFDHDNRKSAPKSINYTGPMEFTPDETLQEVLELVEARFGDNFGDLHPFWFATDAEQAQRQLTRWITYALPHFGDYQDAMMGEEKFLYHSIISFYINAGLLSPLDVCQQAEEAYRDGHAPINAVEGFIRQIIGWREYMRGIYFLEGPDYTSRNELGHDRALPALFWGAETKAPNVIGMSQWADGGVVGSKPYISSGAYIDRMSDYCKGCAYKVKDKTGADACPFNLLYWDFLARHREQFSNNHRMGNMYRVWDKMDDAKRKTVRREAQDWLARLDAGDTV